MTSAVRPMATTVPSTATNRPPRPRAPRIDTTRKGVGLLPGNQRGPTAGHQWGLLHGHGQTLPNMSSRLLTRLRSYVASLGVRRRNALG
jgi:hypothetical protein